ncbi:PREDICTED: serine/arginine-rich splicing factor 1-like [Myotis brandtii]|uniref:serine/arginine-rich splicing factor 1-like n=1 Tax=Myotis brandtii TaxID=109478 RepID=UPI000704789A|nr:PREDICTED: serine/arginine-rich splicing factor 1-like [Myotis brandtii]
MSGGGVIRGRAGNSDCRIYVGNLPPDIRTKDIEDVFYKYGAIREIDLKNHCGGPPFAFVEFEDPQDAQDAVYGRHGYDYDGYRLRVEFPRRGRGWGGGGGAPRGRYGPPSSGRGGGGGGAPRGRYGPPSRRPENRVVVSGLPPSGSWQDLKDHMREAGDVCYADVSRDGTGVVEFVRKEDMTYAVRKLDNTKFRSHEGETAYIRVKADGPRSPGYGRSRSRSHSRSRSRSRSNSRSCSYSPRRSRGSPRYSPHHSRSTHQLMDLGHPRQTSTTPTITSTAFRHSAGVLTLEEKKEITSGCSRQRVHSTPIRESWMERALEMAVFVLNNGRQKRPVMKRLKGCGMAQAPAGPGDRAESSVDLEWTLLSNLQSRQRGNTLPPQSTSELARREE